MDLLSTLLESWDRQCRIVTNVATLVNESNRHVKPSEDGWPLDYHLAHIHGTRWFWLSRVAPERAEQLKNPYTEDWSAAISDLDAIREYLQASGEAIREAVREKVEAGGGPVGGYDNPILFLQHMVWHDGWHVGLLFLGLRLAGQEPAEEWEEANVWGQWRVE